ncbi:UNVERIFIED_CONTAM: hypothetical protein GTU68_027681 [Idotea baltica]|nr:hypothetical protein [Idotea baltica]
MNIAPPARAYWSTLLVLMIVIKPENFVSEISLSKKHSFQNWNKASITGTS